MTQCYNSFESVFGCDNALRNVNQTRLQLSLTIVSIKRNCFGHQFVIDFDPKSLLWSFVTNKSIYFNYWIDDWSCLYNNKEEEEEDTFCTLNISQRNDFN